MRHFSTAFGTACAGGTGAFPRMQGDAAGRGWGKVRACVRSPARPMNQAAPTRENVPMKTHLKPWLAAAALFGATQADAAPTVITFDDLAVGTVLSNQYAASLGVTFSPNAFSGPGGPNGNWATNTNMTIVSATGSDVGGLGGPSLVSGNLLRSFNGWLNENGDSSFAIDFAGGASSVSLDMAGIFTPSSARVFFYDGATQLSFSTSAQIGQVTLSFSAPRITRVIVTPGDFFDWVGVDNLRFTPVVAGVPEPGSWALAGAALMGLALLRRRRPAAR
jgi:hypothetical protein